MKKHVLKCLSAILGVVIAAGVLASCAGSSSSQSSSVAAQNQSSGENQSSQPAEELPEILEFDVYLNYSWWVVNTPFDETNLISKWIMDNKRVKLNFVYPGGDEQEKMNIMLATDTLPDAIMMERDATAKKLVELGKIVKLDDYVQKYDGYRNSVSPDVLEMSKINGGIYSFMNWPLSEEWNGFPQFYYINEKIYKQMGSPNLDSLDDFYKYLQDVKNAKLEVDGLPVVPLQFEPSTLPGHHMFGSFDAGATSFDEVDGKLQYALRKPGTLEAVKFMNKAYNEGIINKDVFAEKLEQVNEKVLNGRIAVYFTNSAEAAVVPATQAFKEGKTDFTYISTSHFPAPAGKTPKDIYTGTVSKLGWNQLMITTNAKDPERIYEFFDWLISPEGQKIVAFGPQGELWDTVDEDNVPILKEGKSLSLSEEEKKKLPIFDFQFLGNAGYYDMAKLKINAAAPEDQRNWVMQRQFEALSAPETSKRKDFTKYSGVVISQELPEFAMAADIDSYFSTQYAKMVTEPNADNIEKMFNETLTEIDKKGAASVEAIWNELYNASKK